MPILSGVSDIAYASKAVFHKGTELAWSQTPEYTFRFMPPTGFFKKKAFNKHFFLDDCRGFDIDTHSVPVTLDDNCSVNINDHAARYRRLCILRTQGLTDPKYYLAPWLTIPFGATAGGFAPLALADQGGSGPTLIRLLVAPFSIYESKISEDIKQRITQQAVAAATPPKLTLTGPTSGIVSARWSATSSPKIEETKCLKKQEIEILVQNTANANGYNYQECLEIINDSGQAVARLYLLFLDAISTSVIFFEAEAQSGSELKITMLDAGSSRVAGYVSRLNGFFSKLGISFAPTNPTLTFEGGQFGVNASRTLTAAAGVNFDSPSRAASDVLTTISDGFSTKLSTAVTSQTLLMFIAKTINTMTTVVKPAVGGGTTETEGGVEGNSKQGRRVVCIFKDNDPTLFHETGHAFGLTHYFYETSTNHPATDADFGTCEELMRNRALNSMASLNVATEPQFYDLHDDMNEGDNINVGNACLVLDGRAPIEDGLTAVQRHFCRFCVDRYPAQTTSNLMDYFPTIKEETILKKKEDLTKHQIELIRYMVSGDHFDIVE